MELSDDGSEDRNEVGLMGEVNKSKDAFELLKTHHRRRTAHKPHYRSMRQEVHYEP